MTNKDEKKGPPQNVKGGLINGKLDLSHCNLSSSNHGAILQNFPEFEKGRNEKFYCGKQCQKEKLTR